MNAPMSETPTQPLDGTETEKQHEDRTGGLVMVGLGAFFLAAYVLDLGLLMLPLLALGFIGWAIARREAGLFIPGGIIGGIGLGILAMKLPFLAPASDGEGGLFLLGFALGWASIPVLTVLFTPDRHWWALIPAAVLALIGSAVLMGGVMLDVLALVGTWWPLALIGWGAWLLFRPRRHG